MRPHTSFDRFESLGALTSTSPSPTSPRVSCQRSVLATEQRFDMTRCGRTFKFYDPLKIGRNIKFYNLPLKRQRK